jgi:long-chain fatty acid transport protein
MNMKLNNIKLIAPRPFRPATLRGLALLALLCGASTSWGEGFRNPPPGAFNLGRAGGRIAHVQDASAITHNPANLMALTNAEVQIAPSVVYMGVDFDSSLAPQSAKTENPWKFLPNAFFAIPADEENMAYGLGITSPYGLSVDWDTDGSSAFAPGVGVLRYTSPNYAELMTLNLNPTVAFNLTDNLSVGLGANVMWSRLTIKQYYPWAIFPGSGGTEPDGTLKGQGDGFGFGGNLGLTWKIGERHTVAFSYRSQMDVDYEGDVELSNITPTAAFLGVTSRSSFDSSIAFPNILAAGYGIQLTDRLRLESNVEWLEFSRFDSLPIDAGNNNIILPPSSQNVPQNWRDTFTVGIAGDYQLTDRWVVRAGYQYYESPVPDSTFSTTIPDADQNVITLGLAYEDGRNAFEIGYGLDFYDTRNISNGGDPTFSGTYKITVHLFALSYRRAF